MESQAGEFGGLLALMIVLLLVAGLAVDRWMSRAAPSVRVRQRAGAVALAAACLVALALLTSIALSDRGFGAIGDRVNELTTDSSSPPAEGGGRFTAASSSRPKHWREAIKVFEDRPGRGTGAGTFSVARLRYRTDERVSRHAHGYVVQTLADTGLLGLAATLALLSAWLVAAGRTLRLHRRRGDWDAQHVALVAVALVPLVFGLQSAIDWTWFVPGPAVMALVTAGFVAGRGPMETSRPGPARLPRPSRPRIGCAAAVLLCGLLFAWAIWQPEASDNSSDEALRLADAGQVGAARAKARDAADANPLSPRPLQVEAEIETGAGRQGAARRALERAALRFPGDPQTLLSLASFQLRTLGRPREALETVAAVLYLDPFSKPGRELYLEARAATLMRWPR